MHGSLVLPAVWFQNRLTLSSNFFRKKVRIFLYPTIFFVKKINVQTRKILPSSIYYCHSPIMIKTHWFRCKFISLHLLWFFSLSLRLQFSFCLTGFVYLLWVVGLKSYLVGGCVRDLVLNRTPKDFDVVTTAKLIEVCMTIIRLNKYIRCTLFIFSEF